MILKVKGSENLIFNSYEELYSFITNNIIFNLKFDH